MSNQAVKEIKSAIKIGMDNLIETLSSVYFRIEKINKVEPYDILSDPELKKQLRLIYLFQSKLIKYVSKGGITNGNEQPPKLKQ